jgi:hypothetical protein
MSNIATGRRPVRDFPPDESEAACAGARELAARPVAPGRLAYGLSAALAAVTAGAMAGTYLMPGLLRGPAVMNGSARGTALAVLLAGVPLLGGSMLLAARGSAGAVITWLGAVAFLLYNSVLFVFGTPANRLFPAYLAMLALAAWSAGVLLRQSDVAALGARFGPRAPARGLAIWIWVVVAANAAVWLARILPAISRSGAPAYLRGTGLPVSVVYAQDLALWLPLLAVAAAWLWRRRPWGFLIAGSGLVLWVPEGVSVAVDQWYGHAVAPASPVASAAVVPAFAALAVVGLIPVVLLLRGLSAGPAGPPLLPGTPDRTWPAWALAAVAVLTGGFAILGGVRLIRDGFGIPVGWLSHTPLTGWTLPGVLLLAGVAAPQLAVAVMIATRSRAALGASYLAGLGLLAWIAVQLLVLQHFFFLQPVVAVLGLAETGLAWLWQRTRGRRSGHNRDLRP